MLLAGFPTENLPKRSHEIEKKERRTQVRTPLMAEDKPSTSASSSLSLIDIVQGYDVLDEESLAAWESEKMENGDMYMEFMLCDGVHSIAKLLLYSIGPCQRITPFTLRESAQLKVI